VPSGWPMRAGRWVSTRTSACTRNARKLCELSADLGYWAVAGRNSLSVFSPGVLWGTVGWLLGPGSHDCGLRAPRLHVVGRRPVCGWRASLLSYWVGRSLINRNSERLRALKRTCDSRSCASTSHLDGISLAAGEEDERRRVRVASGETCSRRPGGWSGVSPT